MQGPQPRLGLGFFLLRAEKQLSGGKRGDGCSSLFALWAKAGVWVFTVDGWMEEKCVVWVVVRLSIPHRVSVPRLARHFSADGHLVRAMIPQCAQAGAA